MNLFRNEGQPHVSACYLSQNLIIQGYFFFIFSKKLYTYEYSSIFLSGKLTFFHIFYNHLK